MAVENVVIAYRANIEDIKRQVTSLQRLNTTLAKSLGTEFTKGATIVRNELTKISQSAKPIELSTGKSTRELRTFTTVVRGANGQLATVRRTVAGTGKNIKVLNPTVTKGATVARTFGQNLATLAKRALLTIPVWFAIRRGIGAVFSTIRDGLKALVEFDRALQKARRNLQGSTEAINANFERLRKEVTQLSIETGKSVEDITNAFQKFATVGFDFETSLAGANNATKLSILLFGDAEETATAFARSMRVLVDESEDARPASEQLAEVMALTAELWKTNAFELNELTRSLERFAPVAKTAGFTAEETVKVLSALSTAGLRGSRAGRLLRTSLTRLVTSTDKLAKSLGVEVNPEVDRTYDVFLRVLDALAKSRDEAGKVAPEFEKVVKSIFGLRSSDAIKGLVALRRNLQEVLGVTGDVAKFNKEFEEVNDTLFQLVARFRNLNRELGKTFVTGLTGGEDFEDALKNIIELQEDLINDARLWGEALNTVYRTLNLIRNIGGAGLFQLGDLFDDLVKDIESAENSLDEQNQKILENNERLLKGLEGQLSRADLENLIGEIETDIRLEFNRFGINKISLRKTRESLTELLESLDPLEPETEVQLGNIQITTEQQSELIEEIIKDQLERLKLEGALESQLIRAEDRLRRQFDVTDDIVKQKTRQLELERAITEEQKERIQFSDESAKLAQIAKDEGIETAVAIGEVLQGQRDFNQFLRIGGKNAELLRENFEDFVSNKELENFFKGIQTPGQDFIRGGERIPIEELGARDFTPIRVETEASLAKARLGLRTATEENTKQLSNVTLALQKLETIALRGGTVTGEDVLKARRGIVPTVPDANFNITIDGRNLDFTFTSREQARQILTSVLSDPRTVERIVNTIPFKKAVDTQIEEF